MQLRNLVLDHKRFGNCKHLQFAQYFLPNTTASVTRTNPIPEPTAIITFRRTSMSTNIQSFLPKSPLNNNTLVCDTLSVIFKSYL